jgi:hypothetical protein
MNKSDQAFEDFRQAFLLLIKEERFNEADKLYREYRRSLNEQTVSKQSITTDRKSAVSCEPPRCSPEVWVE